MSLYQMGGIRLGAGEGLLAEITVEAGRPVLQVGHLNVAAN